ncbi:MAG TPA: glycosyltransferase family 39 protein [Acidimicrobiales bacterium]|nr:glycosyltransferase family 39 protein [Acidimicrobiales bacterium]
MNPSVDSDLEGTVLVSDRDSPVEKDSRPSFDIRLAAILAVAALLRFSVLLIRSFRGSRFATHDTAGYETLSKDLGAFTSKSDPHFALSVLRLPGYPVYLAVTHVITDSRIIGPMILQVLLGVGVVYATYKLGLILFVRPVALCAAAVLALDPMSIIYSSLILSETLYTFLLVCSVALFWRPNHNRWTRGLAAGALLGLATLSRPVSIYLWVPFVIAYLILERKQMRSAGTLVLAFLVGFGVIAGGWVVRNDVMAGAAVISSEQGFNLLYQRAVGSLEESQHLHHARAHAKVLKELKEKLPPHASPGQVAQAEQSLGISIIEHHLGGYIKEAIKGGARLVFGPGNAELGPATGGHLSGLVDGYALVYLIGCYALVLTGLWSAWRRHRLRYCVFPLIVIVYTIFVSSGSEAYSRFRVPIMPYVALLAGVGALFFVHRGPDGAALPRRVIRDDELDD